MKFRLLLVVAFLFFAGFEVNAQNEESAEFLCNNNYVCRCCKRGQVVTEFKKQVETIFERINPSTVLQTIEGYVVECKNNDKLCTIKRNSYHSTSRGQKLLVDEVEYERSALESFCDFFGNALPNLMSKSAIQFTREVGNQIEQQATEIRNEIEAAADEMREEHLVIRTIKEEIRDAAMKIDEANATAQSLIAQIKEATENFEREKELAAVVNEETVKATQKLREEIENARNLKQEFEATIETVRKENENAVLIKNAVAIEVEKLLKEKHEVTLIRNQTANEKAKLWKEIEEAKKLTKEIFKDVSKTDNKTITETRNLVEGTDGYAVKEDSTYTLPTTEKKEIAQTEKELTTITIKETAESSDIGYTSYEYFEATTTITKAGIELVEIGEDEKTTQTTATTENENWKVSFDHDQNAEATTEAAKGTEVATRDTTELSIRETTATLEIENAEEFRRGKEGDEALTECNERQGFCQCRSKEGVLLPGIGPRINCQKLTECQKQWKNVARMNRKSCDQDGRFVVKQCDRNHNVNFCYCVDSDTGRRLMMGYRNYYTLNCNVNCPEGMTYHSCSGCEVTCHNRNNRTVCDQMCRSKCACPYGSFWSGKHQRCVSEKECQKAEAVSDTTKRAEKITEAPKPTAVSMSTTAAESQLSTKVTNRPAVRETTETFENKNVEEFRRGKEGDEALTECNEKRGFCQCRSKEGVLLPGIGPRINCQNLTSCQREFMSDDLKSCDHDGRYLSKFCENNDDNSCFCINPDTGEKLSAVPQNYYKLSCPDDCPEGMTYHSCGGCEVTCHNRNTRTVCDQMCRSKCACPYGSFWSGKYQRCVSEEQC